MKSRLLCLWGLLGTAWAAPDADEVVSLPGWNRELPSKWYSGFINVSETMGMDMMMHYIFIESEGDPAEDPVILWSNGGPGASSLFGLTVEMGPLLLNQDSLSGPEYEATGVPQFFYNPNGWTQLGSVLMFDWPPPVGFSYCNGDVTGDGNSCGVWNDTRAADAEFAALSGWFDLFPERRANQLFLTGESYAGIYIPKLAQQVIAFNEGVGATNPLNLHGIAVGDGCVGTQVLCGGHTGEGPWWTVQFMYGHGQFSTLLYDQMLDVCGVDMLKTGPTSDACNVLLDQMYQEIGGYYDYNLYDDCIYQDDLRRRRRRLQSRSHVPQPLGAAVNDYVCGGGDAQDVWAEQEAVRRALHVDVDSLFFSGDNGEGMTYELTEQNLMPFYTDLALNYPDIRVLVYNGDTDPGINSFATQNWTVALGLIPTESWRPWTLDSCLRMGGYVTRYAGGLDFLTIRGSGHMVPQFKSEAAFSFMSHWIAGESYDTYNASCTAPPSTARRGAKPEDQLASVRAQIARLQAREKDLATAVGA